MLRLTGGLEALHLPLSSACRSMRVLSAIVEVAALSMLDIGQPEQIDAPRQLDSHRAGSVALLEGTSGSGTNYLQCSLTASVTLSAASANCGAGYRGAESAGQAMLPLKSLAIRVSANILPAHRRAASILLFRGITRRQKGKSCIPTVCTT